MMAFAPQPVAAAAQQTQNPAQTYGNNAMDMNAFLKMFTTQLQYQDPTNPLESYELAAQLAQFSTVEKLAQLNANIQFQQTLLTSINNAQMVDMLGKQVTGLYDGIQVKDGQVSKGQIRLDQPAEKVTVKIYDDQDQLVRTITLGKTEAGQYDVNWDGKDEAGNAVPEGNYRFEAEAVDAKGNEVEVTEMVVGKVFAFRIEDGTPYLILENSGGLKLPINTVMQVVEAV